MAATSNRRPIPRPHFLFHITRRRASFVANSIRSSIECLYFTCLFRHLILFLLLIAIIYHFSLSIAFIYNFSSSIFVNPGLICAQLTLLYLQLELFLLPGSSRKIVSKFQSPGLVCRDNSSYTSSWMKSVINNALG